MRSGTNLSDVGGYRRSLVTQFHWFRWRGIQLVVVASALHVFLAVALSIAGRTQIAPAFIDQDGIIDSFAHDSYEYQNAAIRLAAHLKNGELGSWAAAAQPIHVKLLAVAFALLGPFFGYGTLSAEPYNVLCYAAVVGLTFALGNEVYSRRVGLLAGAAVAILPTFLLHTTQLLKDHLFIAGLLGFILCVTTSLTRTYRPLLAAGVTGGTILMLLLLFFVRRNVIIVMLVIGLLDLGLLTLRQYFHHQLLLWNMVPAMALLLTGLLLISFYSAPITTKQKQFPSEGGGRPKLLATTELQVPTRMVRVLSPASRWAKDSVVGRSGAAADKSARLISAMRSRFAAAYPEAGSSFDGSKEFGSFRELVEYLPRALAVGLWAPFPDRWGVAGRRLGNPGRLLSAAEMLLIYLCQVLALLAIMREPKRPALWLLLAVAVMVTTALAVVVPNVGALYRFRYTFWILIIVVAMVSVDNLFPRVAARMRSWRQLSSSAPNADTAAPLITK
jgi:putative peptidoglycan lipid II flippase